MVCKKQEQCKLGKMCGWAKDEETLLTECVEFIERVPQTNEEWLRQATTEQLAEFLHGIVIRAMQATWDGKKPDYPAYLSDWKKWLKEKHYGNT